MKVNRNGQAEVLSRANLGNLFNLMPDRYRDSQNLPKPNLALADSINDHQKVFNHLDYLLH